MADYKEMYLIMVRASEKAVRLLTERDGKYAQLGRRLAAEALVKAQRRCEEMYLNADEETTPRQD